MAAKLAASAIPVGQITLARFLGQGIFMLGPMMILGFGARMERTLLPLVALRALFLIAIGVLGRREICVPTRALHDLGEDELSALLGHELAHHYRGHTSCVGGRTNEEVQRDDMLELIRRFVKGIGGAGCRIKVLIDRRDF